MKRGKTAIAALFLALALAGSASTEIIVQACFSPQGKCSAHIIGEIAKARKEILVAVYAFTSDDLAWALVKAQQRGVSVRVILDREFDAGSDNSRGDFLAGQTVPVRRISGMKSAGQNRGVGLMHQKFAVIDRAVVLTGSYNWTHAADALNDENLLLFRNAGPLAEEYRKMFLGLWERPH